MPFAIAQTSLLWGVVLILVSGSASALGLYFQGLCAAFVPVGRSSFFSISLVTHPSLSVVFDAAIAIKCFGVGVSYLIIVAQLMPQIMDYFLTTTVVSAYLSHDSESSSNYHIFQSRVFWVTAALVVAGPLSFARRLDSLKYTSVVALISVGYLVVLVLVKFVLILGSGNGINNPNPNPPSGDAPLPSSPLQIWLPESFANLLSVLPVLVFAFTCHQNMFASINELALFNQEQIVKQSLENDANQETDPLEYPNSDPILHSGLTPLQTDPENRPGEYASPRPSERTFLKIVTASVYPAAFTYLAVGIAGYLTFGNNVKGNIMTMYEYSLSTVIGRIAIVVLVLFSYPLQVHPCRASVSNIVNWLVTKKRSTKELNHDSNSQDSHVQNYNSNDAGTSTLGYRPNTNTELGERSSLLEESVEPQVVAPQGKETLAHLVHDSHIPFVPYVIITTFIIACSFLIAVKVDSLEVVLAFVGATGSTSISFILPGLFAYTLLKKANKSNSFSRDYAELDNELEESAEDVRFREKVEEYHATFYSRSLGELAVYKRDKLREVSALVLFVLGVVVLVVCLAVNVWNLYR